MNLLRLGVAARSLARFGALVLVALVLATTGILGAPAKPATAATGYSLDLYFRSGYERQIDGRTCTAASTAMMLNFIARRDLGLSQRSLLRYAQKYDALNDRRQRGSDPLGWSRAATYFSVRTGKPTTYRWEAYATRYATLKRAARLIAKTRKPVGLLVAGGKHAVVMTGFRATSDPRKGDFRLTAIWISDPYGARHVLYGVDNTPFRKYRELDATAKYDRAWYGKFVIVAPVPDLAPTPTPTPAPSPTPLPDPTAEPTPEASENAVPDPTAEPTVALEPTAEPDPTAEPTVAPEPEPTAEPDPTAVPTIEAAGPSGDPAP